MIAAMLNFQRVYPVVRGDYSKTYDGIPQAFPPLPQRVKDLRGIHVLFKALPGVARL